MKQRKDELMPNYDVNNGGYLKKIQLVNNNFSDLSNEETMKQVSRQEQLRNVSKMIGEYSTSPDYKI